MTKLFTCDLGKLQVRDLWEWMTCVPATMRYSAWLDDIDLGSTIAHGPTMEAAVRELAMMLDLDDAQEAHLLSRLTEEME